MKNFTYHVPTKVVFGADRERRIGELLRAEGATKVLLIHGRQCAECHGLYERVTASLEEAGLVYNDISDVYPPPLWRKANEGIALGRIEDSDYILAVGGPAVVNVAKAVAVGIPNEGDIWEYYQGKRTPKTVLPIGVIVTSVAGSGEMSAIAQLTNKTERQSKIAYWNDVRPSLAVINPMLTFTLNRDDLYGGIAEIFMLTMERYFTHDSTMELTDNICEVLMRVLIRNTQIMTEEPNVYEARANIMWASALAHSDMIGCGNGWGDITVHNMAKELVGLYNVPQGIALAAIWCAWARKVYEANVYRFYCYGRTVWNLPRDYGTKEEIALQSIRFTADFFRHVGLLGAEAYARIREETIDVDQLVERVMDGETQIGRFKVLTREDVREIYELSIEYLHEGNH